MDISYKLREQGVFVNLLTVEESSGSGVFTVSLLREDRHGNKVVLAQDTGVSKPYIKTFNLPLDADGNPLRINYIIREQEEVWGSVENDVQFNHFYIPFIPEINLEVDGFGSTCEGGDVSDYTGYDFVNRELVVSPPAPLSQKTSTEAFIPFLPNIYSGEWKVSLMVKVSDEVDGYIVEDEVYIENTYTIRPGFSEEEMFLGVKDLFGTYKGWLKSAPKKALDIQPIVVEVGNLLHQYFASWRQNDTVEAYRYMSDIYEILSPKYLSIGVGVDEIFPSSPAGVDHTHSNLLTIEGFTEEDGVLSWFGIPLTGGDGGGGAETGRVKLKVEDSLGYLGGKLDSSLEVKGDKLGVRESYISEYADGVTILYDPITKKFSAAAGGEVPPIEYTVRKWTAGSYIPTEMVYLTSDGVDTFYVCKTSTTNSPPHTDWRLAYESSIRHERNKDIRLGNHVVNVSKEDIVSGVLTIGWQDKNAVRILDGVGESVVSSIFGGVSEQYDDLTVPSQDITITYQKDDSTLTLAEGGGGTNRIPFFNAGYKIVLDSTGAWARYRYNKDRNRFDLIATSLRGDESSSVELDDFSAEVVSDNESLFRYVSGVYTLNKNLNFYDNSISEFIKSTEVNAAVEEALEGVDHNDFSGKQGGAPGDYQHITEINRLVWDGKQDKIEGGASSITQDNLTADRLLVSGASGKVEASNVPLEALNSLFEASSLRAYPIRLNGGATVGQRLNGLVEGVDYPTGWSLVDDGAALIITHGLGRVSFDVKVRSKLVGGNMVMLTGSVAYATLTDGLDEGVFKTIRLDALATVNTELLIHVVI